MHRISVVLLAIAGCATAPAVKPASTGDLEARVKSLEAENAKNADALAFLRMAFEQQRQAKAAEEANTLAEDGVFAVDVAGSIKAGQVDGPATALVTIVKAFDFACPYCQRVSETLDALVAEHKGDVRVVYKNFVVHPAIAMPAHLASCAAAKQGKYLAFKNAFWAKAFLPYAAERDPSKLGEANIIAIAKELGLDTAKLVIEMGGADCKARVAADMADLEKFHVSSTPTFFINGQVIQGALPKDAFETIITAKLASARASGVPGGEYYDKVIMGKGEKAFRSKKDPKPR